MDIKSKQIFEVNSGYILNEASQRYAISKTDLKKLGSFESFVYEYEKNGQSRILKITHNRHRTVNQIKGELEWVNFLAENKVSVPPVIRSKNKELVELINVDDSYFLIYAFEKASGSLPEQNLWDDVLFENWGRVMGRMHAVTKKYRPSDKAIRRFHWYEDPSLRVEKHIPPSQPKVIEKYNRLKNKLLILPTDMDSYGLIHSDLHHDNFFVDNDKITVFDFDDCHYSWYAFDISIPLFYVLRDSHVDPNDKSFARHFMKCFMTGYRQENNIDISCLGQIPDFLKLREIDLYSIIHAEEALNLNDWCQRFMEERQSRIENDVPIIEIDFSVFG